MPAAEQPTARIDPLVALGSFERDLSSALSSGLRSLIETKHIYQRVTVNPAEILGRYLPQVATDVKSSVVEAANRIRERRFKLVAAGEAESDSDYTRLDVGNVKTFCGKCDSAEVAALQWSRDIVAEVNRPTAFMNPRAARRPLPSAHQVFVLAYQCQRCQGELDVYTVRRANWALVLDGRSPMENIELSKFIPKAEQHLYRDALIASHGGKTLAALFYLRCFIEQFARRQTGITRRMTGDEIMAAYAGTLPATQRDAMPSLKEQYDVLSEAIHAVSEDSDLFERTRKLIDKHFDIRRVFEIPERTPGSSR